MIIKGVVTTGALRGEELIKIYADRIKHVLGFAPFHGTLDVRIEKYVVIEDYATRRIEHLLMNGRPHVYAYLAPVHLKIMKSSTEEDCWLIKIPASATSNDVIELIAPHNLRKDHELQDGDAVEITFFKKIEKKKKPVTNFFKKIGGKETRISR